MRTPSELSDLFRERGFKMTAQRERIFSALHGASDHPTAEAVWSEVRTDMSSISLRTVYQTLNDLVGMGELAQLDIGPGPARFDPMNVPHHHVVCDACGRIADLTVEFPSVGLPDELAGDFDVVSTEIIFRASGCGVCRGAEG
ncbi:MAG TPA: transcriptional repressor [Acidimicrobiales bacterium]|nr:transcriptional repressor [Acidimicrobiales bacterium]